MSPPTINPFAPTINLPEERQGVFTELAECEGKNFLYRRLNVMGPFPGTLLYDGRWFRQKIEFAGHLVWFRISWLIIHRKAEFRLPPAVDPEQRTCRMEIDFSRFLWIRRFRIWMGETLVYDEIN
ncbi:hypothetical protein [Crateriforma conspicua]|uniref:hypothetical protein n=1 Tax=Crateriforma conspicua TaxID=2527996 RepID=UPI00118B2B10|nr:hypothetical protein [Crateriforma conspicua]QDV64723.1 hypothetical protein Mal65_38860 [Crateriforma conspicua]